MRTVGLLGLFLVASAGVVARPATLIVGGPHPAAVVYGPADMLCDLNKCRLFNLPAAVAPRSGTIVEFGLPQMDGQNRVDIRRCFQMCRASVLGFESDPTSDPQHSRPTIFITPIELRLE